MKTLNIEITVATARVTYEGGMDLEIIGRTVNDVSHKIIITLAPSAIGYLGRTLHEGMNGIQKKLDAAKTELRGDE